MCQGIIYNHGYSLSYIKLLLAHLESSEFFEVNYDEEFDRNFETSITCQRWFVLKDGQLANVLGPWV